MLRNTVKSIVGRRNLSINEFRSAQLLRKYDVATPAGGVAQTVAEANVVAKKLFGDGRKELVVKAQALTGGRGKGHFDNGFPTGIKMVNSVEEAGEVAGKMLNHRLITKQSGEKGKLVSHVFLVVKKEILKEAYLSILMDRSKKMPLIIVCKEGGMNIEEVAARNPDAIKKFYVNSLKGVDDELGRQIGKELGFDEKLIEETSVQIQNLYKIFSETDATQIEINPISEVEGGRVMCMDAKFGFDDNAAFRQKEIFSWRNDVEATPEEKFSTEAKNDYDLNFVKLHGNIGCLVNGAGLAMATMDVIQLYGGKPANFLDCGGGATPETVKKAFELIIYSCESTGTPLDAIFVNIFGGIVRCDYVAQGIVDAIHELDLKNLPIVARLQGTNFDKGREIVKDSKLNISLHEELDPAAENVVKASIAHAN